MTPVPAPTQPPQWLQDYINRGFELVFFPAKQKGPTGKDAIGWTTKQYQAKDYIEGENVGVRLGTEIAAGRYLVDVDLDWGGCEVLAKRLLPPAGFGFGRGDRKITHVFYTIPQPVPSKAYNDITGRTLIELRCRKIDGSVGLQTMLPPSIHPSGQPIEMRAGGPITHEPDLPRAILILAITAELYFNVGERGFLHNARVGFAGFLLQCGLTEEEVVLIGETLAEATGNNIRDVGMAVRSTAQKMRNGDKVIGKKGILEAIGEDQGKKVCAKIKEYLGGGDFLVNDKDQILANSQENIKRALRKMDVTLSYDQFSEKEMVRYGEYVGPLNDKVRNRIWLEMDALFHFRPQADFFDTVVLDACHQEPYHPVLQYLDELVWDGKPRIDNWLIEHGGAADTAYVKAVSSLVLIAAVRRVRQPGCKFDELLVLESEQGMLKSSALRALCPKAAWFSDDLPLGVDSKLVIERTNGKWIIEAAELSGMHRSQVEHLKSMLSRQVDGPVRLAYARMPVERPRQHIIVGTTNSHAYLKDKTGNRRFWPVRVGRFNIMQLTEIRDQLWAEAAAREKAGESSRLDPKLYVDAEFQQTRRNVEDSWESLLQEHFDKMRAVLDREGRIMTLRLTTAEIFQILGIPVAGQDERSSERLAGVMQSLDFRRITVRRSGSVLKGWGWDGAQQQLPGGPQDPTGGESVE
jgi:predicted P-loop ATPase